MSRTRLRRKGQLTIPEDIRAAARLEEGDLLEAQVTDDGILLRPQKVVDATQAWFWTPAGRQANARLTLTNAAGRMEAVGSGDEFVAALRARAKKPRRARRARSRVPSFAWAARFGADFDSLSAKQQAVFLTAVEQFVEDLRSGRFRKGLRVKSIKGAPGVFEMTWADGGRATCEYGEPVVKGEVHVFWRRVGTQMVFREP